ncbi:MAG: hypothetical protein IT198_15430 [Acidimicrobiia bacterium]|nr:hypothetical protein [Acidimicrobiia bacterium]
MAMHDETAPRWQGRPGLMEVWYSTCTEADGTGWWFHHERVAPVDGDNFVHGWTAVFPPHGPPVAERFGPGPDRTAGDALLSGDGWDLGAGSFTGKTDRLAWDVEIHTHARPLYTFPRWAWEREVLPAAQIVDLPQAHLAGTVSVDGATRHLEAHGAQAHIYGRGSAARWAWLHADLDDETTLEVVAAVPHLPRPLSIPPRPVVRLRSARGDEPADSLLTALRGRASATLPRWFVRVPLPGRRRLDVTVNLAPERCIQLEYPNPDGTRAYCTNSERADVHVQLERGRGPRRVVEREWDLTGRAHAEVGLPEPWSEVEVMPFPGA